MKNCHEYQKAIFLFPLGGVLEVRVIKNELFLETKLRDSVSVAKWSFPKYGAKKNPKN